MLSFDDPKQKSLYDRVVEATREVYTINDKLVEKPAKQVETTLIRKIICPNSIITPKPLKLIVSGAFFVC